MNNACTNTCAVLSYMPLGNRTSSRPSILDILVNMRCDHYGTFIHLMSAILHHQSVNTRVSLQILAVPHTYAMDALDPHNTLEKVDG